MERSKLKLCKFCDSGRIVKHGIRKNKKGEIQHQLNITAKTVIDVLLQTLDLKRDGLMMI